MKEIGVNYASRFIPCMIDAIGHRVSTWKSGEKYNLLKEMGNTTFEIITVILFGKNVNESIGDLAYTDCITEQIKPLPFDEFYTQLSRDLAQNRFNLLNIFFPFFNTYNLIRPYSIHKKNIDELWKRLGNYLDKSKDEDSLYYRLVYQQKLEKDKVFHDLLAILFAGHETSSHAISSTLYFLEKNPDTFDKLAEELKDLKGKIMRS